MKLSEIEGLDTFKDSGMQIGFGVTDDLESKIFGYEKETPTIQKELEAFCNQKTLESEKSFTLDSLSENTEKKSLIAEENEEENLQENNEEDLREEDFTDTSELIISGLEFAMTFGANFYLKSKGCETLDGSEIEASKRQKKNLVKLLNKILLKYNAKMSVELTLVITLLAVYGMTTRNAIKQKVAESKQKKPIKQDRKPPLKVVRNVNEAIKEDREEEEKENLRPHFDLTKLTKEKQESKEESKEEEKEKKDKPKRGRGRPPKNQTYTPANGVVTLKKDS